MGEVKQINIKNRTYYFYNDIIDLKDFDGSQLKVDQKKKKKKKYNEIDIYQISYVTFKKIADCNNINRVNLLYLMINEMIGRFEEKNENKYVVLDDVDENKKVSKKYQEVWESVKKEIGTITGGELGSFSVKIVNFTLNYFQMMLYMSEYKNATVPKN